MNNYFELRVTATPCSDDITDLLAGFLAEIGYESFLADEKGITAYIPEKDFSAENVEEVLNSFPMDATFDYSATLIEGEDWNKEWEKNYFKPIVIGTDCVIHSTFHTDIPEAEFDISIDPKMAFGTGHHATTRLILGFLLEQDLNEKSVIDMGSGTGILAILCAMKGASPVTGIEIDEAAHANALENINLNGVDVKMIHGESKELELIDPADLFIANINRNIILADLDKYSSRLLRGGVMVLSGFYQKDIPLLVSAGERYGLIAVETRQEDDWAALILKKS